MVWSRVFYDVLTLVGGIAALELAASVYPASIATECPYLIFNAVKTIRESVAKHLSNGPKPVYDLLWIDDFGLNQDFLHARYPLTVIKDPTQMYCAPSRAHFALALCVYFASVTTLYRRHRNKQTLRNLVMAICIALPVLVGVVCGRSVEYIATALVPLAAWAGLAAMPVLVLLVEHKVFRELPV